MTQSFGEALKSLRAERKLSQNQLAKSAGLSAGFIARMESENRRPRLATIFIISSVLGLNQKETQSLCEAANYEVPFEKKPVLSLFKRAGFSSPPITIPEKKEKIIDELLKLLSDPKISSDVKNSIKQSIRSLLKVVSQSQKK